MTNGVFASLRPAPMTAERRPLSILAARPILRYFGASPKCRVGCPVTESKSSGKSYVFVELERCKVPELWRMGCNCMATSDEYFHARFLGSPRRLYTAIGSNPWHWYKRRLRMRRLTSALIWRGRTRAWRSSDLQPDLSEVTMVARELIPYSPHRNIRKIVFSRRMSVISGDHWPAPFPMR
jgi:hypothetical protein